MSKRLWLSTGLPSPMKPFAIGHRSLAGPMPNGYDPRQGGLEIAGISMRSICRSMASCSSCGARSIKTAKCSIFWCNRAATGELRRSSFANCCDACSMCHAPSSPTSSAAMPPPRLRYCAMCCTSKGSERIIGRRIHTSQRGSANVECEASSRPGTPSVSSQRSESLHRSFVQVDICWQLGIIGKSCAGASHNGTK
jgi:hypothetical protein